MARTEKRAIQYVLEVARECDVDLLRQDDYPLSRAMLLLLKSKSKEGEEEGGDSPPQNVSRLYLCLHKTNGRYFFEDAIFDAKLDKFRRTEASESSWTRSYNQLTGRDEYADVRAKCDEKHPSGNKMPTCPETLRMRGFTEKLVTDWIYALDGRCRRMDENHQQKRKRDILPIVVEISKKTERVKAEVLKSLQEEESIVEAFPAAFSSLQNGIRDKLTSEELSFSRLNLPLNEETLHAMNDEREILLAYGIWKKKVGIIKENWTHDSTIRLPGDVNFNSHVTEYLVKHFSDNPSLRCTTVCPERADDKFQYAIYQCVVKAVVTPITPIHRLGVIHATGTGKSLSIIAMLDNFFYDMRPKVVIVPTVDIQQEIIKNLIAAPPIGPGIGADVSPLKRWAEWWFEKSMKIEHPEASSLHQLYRDNELDTFYELIGAMNFTQYRGMVPHTLSKSEDEDDAAEREEERYRQEQEDDDDDDKSVRMRPRFSETDGGRRERLKEYREGYFEGEYKDLLAPILFVTYEDLSTRSFFRDPQMKAFHCDKNGYFPYTGYIEGKGYIDVFDEKIVLMDEVHTLFDETSQHLPKTAEQRKNLLGDRAKYENAKRKYTEFMQCLRHPLGEPCDFASSPGGKVMYGSGLTAPKIPVPRKFTKGIPSDKNADGSRVWPTSEQYKRLERRHTNQMFGLGIRHMISHSTNSVVVGFTATPFPSKGGGSGVDKQYRALMDFLQGSRRRSGRAANHYETDEGFISYFMMRPTPQLFASVHPTEKDWPHLLPVFSERPVFQKEDVDATEPRGQRDDDASSARTKKREGKPRAKADHGGRSDAKTAMQRSDARLRTNLLAQSLKDFDGEAESRGGNKDAPEDKESCDPNDRFCINGVRTSIENMKRAEKWFRYFHDEQKNHPKRNVFHVGELEKKFGFDPSLLPSYKNPDLRIRLDAKDKRVKKASEMADMADDLVYCVVDQRFDTATNAQSMHEYLSEPRNVLLPDWTSGRGKDGSIRVFMRPTIEEGDLVEWTTRQDKSLIRHRGVVVPADFYMGLCDDKEKTFAKKKEYRDVAQTLALSALGDDGPLQVRITVESGKVSKVCVYKDASDVWQKVQFATQKPKSLAGALYSANASKVEILGDGPVIDSKKKKKGPGTKKAKEITYSIHIARTTITNAKSVDDVFVLSTAAVPEIKGIVVHNRIVSAELLTRLHHVGPKRVAFYLLNDLKNIGEGSMGGRYWNRLQDYKSNLDSRMITAAYGTQLTAYNQANVAILSEENRKECDKDGSCCDVATSNFSTYAPQLEELVRTIEKYTTDETSKNYWKGKVIVLLNENRGLAYFKQYVDSCIRQGSDKDLKIEVLGAFKKSDISKEQQQRSRATIRRFNANDNTHGRHIKVLVLGAQQFGTGVDFTSVRHVVVLDPPDNWYEYMQYVGRALRRCKHMSLPRDERNVNLHMAAFVTWKKSDRPDKNIATLTKTVRIDDFVPDHMHMGVSNAVDMIETGGKKKKLTKKEKDIRQTGSVLREEYYSFALDPVFVSKFLSLDQSKCDFNRGMKMLSDVALDGVYYAKYSGWSMTDIRMDEIGCQADREEKKSQPEEDVEEVSTDTHDDEESKDSKSMGAGKKAGKTKKPSRKALVLKSIISHLDGSPAMRDFIDERTQELRQESEDNDLCNRALCRHFHEGNSEDNTRAKLKGMCEDKSWSYYGKAKTLEQLGDKNCKVDEVLQKRERKIHVDEGGEDDANDDDFENDDGEDDDDYEDDDD